MERAVIDNGLALQAMGYRTSRREIYATMHFWRYVGHLMGVRPRWFPRDLKEAGQLAFVTFAKGANRAGEDGRKLCQSYVDAFSPREDETRTLEGKVRAGIEHGVHVGMTRFFLPTWIYKQMEMPPAGLWALSPLARFPFLFAAETLRRHFPRLDAIADRNQRRKRRRWLDHHLAGKKARFRAVESFAR